MRSNVYAEIISDSLWSFIECNRCGCLFDPHRSTVLATFDSFRCRSCGHQHTSDDIERIRPESDGEDDKRLYLMKQGEYIKIGVSKNPDWRVRQLQVGNAEEIELVKTWNPPHARKAEGELHAQLLDASALGEWFEYDTSDLTGLVDAIGLFVNGGGGR